MWSNVGGVTLPHNCDDIGELCKLWGSGVEPSHFTTLTGYNYTNR